MFGLVASLLIRIAATNAEIECRTDPIDYDVAECDGMVEHLLSVPHIEWIPVTK